MTPAEMQRWAPRVRVNLVHPLRALKALARDFDTSDAVFRSEMRRVVDVSDLDRLPALAEPRTFLTSERTQR